MLIIFKLPNNKNNSFMTVTMYIHIHCSTLKKADVIETARGHIGKYFQIIQLLIRTQMLSHWLFLQERE